MSINYYGNDKDKIFSIGDSESETYKKVIQNINTINYVINKSKLYNDLTDYDLYISSFNRFCDAVEYAKNLVTYIIKDNLEYRYTYTDQIIYFFENANYIIVVGNGVTFNWDNKDKSIKVRLYSKKQ